MFDFDPFFSTKAEKYVAYNGYFQIILRIMFFKSLWFKGGLKLLVYKVHNCNVLGTKLIQFCVLIVYF